MKNSILFFLVVITNSLSSQVTLLDENFTMGIPSTWSLINDDALIPADTQFLDAWIDFTSSFDTCAASTSSYVDLNGDEDTSAIAADFLISPKISLLSFGNLLSWDAKSLDGSFPDGYEVLISTADSLKSSFQSVLKTVESETPYWKHYSINLTLDGYNNQDVYIAFKNITKNGYVLLLDNIKITGDDPAKIKEKDFSLAIFPNPFQKKLRVNVDNFESIEIININGKTVINSNQKIIDTSNLPAGIYILKVKAGGTIITKKIVK